MTEINASLVKALRERTGLGMMDCKKALAEAGGDMAKAEELLRIRSGTKASRAAARLAAEGVIGAWLAEDRRTGALVELNCETDFVAKNEDFRAFAQELAALVGHLGPADLATLGSCTSAGGTVEARRQALVQRIGENIAIRRFERLAAKGTLACYVHAGRIGVLVDYEGPAEVGKDLALHIAFARPAWLARADVPEQVLARERDILAARARQTGKPEAIVAKMVDGGLAKFVAENTLLGQPFVRDDKLSVERMLSAQGARVHGYRFLVVGEGIEKPSTDFAAEVRAAAGQA